MQIDFSDGLKLAVVVDSSRFHRDFNPFGSYVGTGVHGDEEKLWKVGGALYILSWLLIGQHLNLPLKEKIVR